MTEPAKSETDSRRESISAFAIICRQDQGRTVFLTQWNLHWRALNLVGGKKRPEESFQQCVVREIQEELRLSPGEDFTLVDQRPLRMEFEAFSDGAWELTAYTMEVFRIVLSGEEVLARIAANADNRWVTESEILGGRCTDGTRISPTVARIVLAALKEQPF
jgi:8-oxo-dGTP pyrophosphatase MutT (NUDIX family)